MSNYSQTTFFGPKDSLPLGNPAKIIEGTDIDTELANIATAIATKYDSSSIASGPIGFQAGSASLPAIYLGSSTTTGLYQPAANQLGLSVSGSNVLTVSSTTMVSTLSVQGTAFIPSGSTVPSNGMFLPAANTVGIAANGSQMLTLTTGALTVYCPITVSNSITGVQQSWVEGAHTLAVQAGGGQYGFGTSSNDPLGLFVNGGSNALQITTGNVVQVVDDGGTMQNVGYRGFPINAQTGNYTLQLSDRNKCVMYSSGSASTVTVPANVFSPGDTIDIAVVNGTLTYTISPGSGVTLWYANGTDTNTSRSLKSVGIAQLVCTSSNVFVITGSAGAIS